MLKKTFNKFLSVATGLKPKVKSLNCKDFETVMKPCNLEIKPPEFRQFYPTYVLMRRLKFHPEMKLTVMPKFENMIRWKVLREEFSITQRSYPLAITPDSNNMKTEDVCIKKPNANAFSEKEVNINKSVKVFEELLEIMPYTRAISRKNLFNFPIARSPLYKLHFTRGEIKAFREELAIQNKTVWTNVEVVEIYDKFNSNLFNNIKQIPNSRNLMFYPDISNARMKAGSLQKPDISFYYLIIGRKKDTSEFVKALSRLL